MIMPAHPGDIMHATNEAILGCAGAGGGGPSGCLVQEFELAWSGGGMPQWVLARPDVRVGDKRVFAPANLRAAAEHEPYRRLVGELMAERYTLRYSGGLVPDVHHILAKVRAGEGIRDAHVLFAACLVWALSECMSVGSGVCCVRLPQHAERRTLASGRQRACLSSG